LTNILVSECDYRCIFLWMGSFF